MIYKDIAIETTRKCNMNCIHCLKGESQNKSITKDVIDKIFDNVENDIIIGFSFFGGEPTLEIDIIEYTCEQIIKRGINVFHILITTNGTIFDKRLIDVILKMDEYCYSKQKEFNYIGIEDPIYTCSIKFSLLEHENNEHTKEVYKKYQSAIKSNNIKIRTFDINTYSYNIIYQGNAKDNFEKLKKKYVFRLKEPMSSIRDAHTNLCEKVIYFDINGNVFPTRCFSYNIENKFNDYYLGNIKNKMLYDMIEDYNFRYPLDHDLGIRFEFLKTLLFNKENNIEYKSGDYNNYIILNESENNIIQGIECYKTIMEIRKDLHTKYQFLTYDEIVDMSVYYMDYKLNGEYKNITSKLCGKTPIYFKNTGYKYLGKNKSNELFTNLEIENLNRKIGLL